MERDEKELSTLFAAYRDAVQAPEPTAAFMPGIWSRIDSRRGFGVALRRWTGALVTAAAALCLAMIIYMASPGTAASFNYAETYVEALEQTGAMETLAYSETVEFEFIDASAIE